MQGFKLYLSVPSISFLSYVLLLIWYAKKSGFFLKSASFSYPRNQLSPHICNTQSSNITRASCSLTTISTRSDEIESTDSDDFARSTLGRRNTIQCLHEEKGNHPSDNQMGISTISENSTILCTF